MKNILNHKFWWVAVIAMFIALIAVISFIHYRVDVTEEKRFSLSNSTKSILENVDSTITIDVFLTGDLPADYKKLSIATKDLLDVFKDRSSNNISVNYVHPKIDLKDSSYFLQYDTTGQLSALKPEEWREALEANYLDSISQLGVTLDDESVVKYRNKEIKFDQIVFPSAIVSYANRKPMAIDLRSSRKVFKTYNVVTEEPQEDVEGTRNAAEALLEYKFANAIDKLTRTKIPTIAYLVGNGEPTDLTVNDLGESLRNEYRLAILDLKQQYPNAEYIDALIITKPKQAFTEEDKLKIDQYVMNGGKVLWCIDRLTAEFDSLMRSQADFIALDKNLNLDDILFKYGVRINPDLLQDLNCSKVPVVLGYNTDGSPRMQRIPFPYYPFLTSPNNNPISKNIDRVLSIFPSSIDTVKVPGIAKTVLLATDTSSRTLAQPAMVSLNSVPSEAHLNSFVKSRVPVAVLLEGAFTSMYTNRLDNTVKDSVKATTGKDFIANGKPTKQIVISDADIITNQVSKTTGPTPMGMLPMENYRFANREFFLNSIDYLVNTNNLFESRNKDFTLRLLDKQKVTEQKSMWQIINIGLPLAVIFIIGITLQALRKKKFAS